MKETSAKIENESRKSGQEHKGDDIMKFTVTHNNKTFAFDTADELYIFGLGIELDIERKLNTDIGTFVKTVREHHRRDCFTAPLKDFTEFIITWWDKTTDPDEFYLVNKFYELRDN